MTTHGNDDAERAGVPEIPDDHPEADAPSLLAALGRLRAAIVAMRYPLAVPGAEAARGASGRLVARIDEYLVPRTSRGDAALLVVVGGPTGSGKSTLVNSLARAPVSRTGVLRPTTRAPALVCHPDDTPWFTERSLLPELGRSSGLRAGLGTLHLVSAPGLPAGLALLDAPDVDSVIDSSPRDPGSPAGGRLLADRLLAPADLWLFVTTAARYADAVPWAALRAARERGTAVAMVLNRVPPGAEDEVCGDFGAMLDAQGMGQVTLFVLPEMALGGQGMLAERLVGPLRAWLLGLVEDPARRTAVVEDAMYGALAGTGQLVRRLAGAAYDQVVAAEALHQEVRGRYEAAEAALAEALRDGSLLRGEVLAGCRELSATGGKVPDERLAGALQSTVGSLIQEIVLEADEQVRDAWRGRPEGRALLEASVPQRLSDPQAAAAATRLVHDWDREVAGLAPNPGVARVIVTLAVLDGAPEVPRSLIAGQVSPELVERAHADLLERIRRLLAAQADRYHAAVDAEPVDAESAVRLRELARTIGEGQGGP